MATMQATISDIRAEFDARGLTQRELAELLTLSRGSVSDRLTGRTRWTLSDAVTLSDALGMPLDAVVRALEGSR